jgi:hypothetical protein
LLRRLRRLAMTESVQDFRQRVPGTAWPRTRLELHISPKAPSFRGDEDSGIPRHSHQRDVVKLGRIADEALQPGEQVILHFLGRPALVGLDGFQQPLTAEGLLLRILRVDDAVGVEEQQHARGELDRGVAPAGFFDDA